jgi:alcohol dehydrogenase
MLPLHPMELFDGRRITGCVFGDFKGKSQLPEIVEKCMQGVSTEIVLTNFIESD